MSRQHLQQSQQLHPIFDVLKKVVNLEWWFILKERKHRFIDMETLQQIKPVEIRNDYHINGTINVTLLICILWKGIGILSH